MLTTPAQKKKYKQQKKEYFNDSKSINWFITYRMSVCAYNLPFYTAYNVVSISAIKGQNILL